MGSVSLLSIFRRSQRSLRARIIIPTGFLFALILAAMGIGAVQLHGSDVSRHQVEKAELFSQVVANGLASLMLDHGPEATEVNAFLSVVASHRAEIHSISILRGSGLVSHSSLAKLIGTQAPGEAPLGDAAGAPAIADSPSLYTVRQPLRNQPSCSRCHSADQPVVGWLEVRFDRGLVAAEKNRLAATMLATALPAFFVLLLATSWLLRREVIRPLHGLVGAMQKARAGDLTVRADNLRPDELGVAARGFDDTLRALREAHAEVESFYRERMLQADRFATVGELATGLAHEIRNPLAGLSGALEVLAEDFRGTAEQKDVIVEMQHQVTRLARTMDSLLDFARPPQSIMRPTDVNKSLQNVVFLVQQQRNKAPIEIRTEMDPSLAPVIADPSQLEQVFLNLCLNAVQALPSGGVLVVRSRATETGVTVEIEDSGPGIPPEIRQSVFRPFFTTKRNGSGLGLAISARIVADHGGHIDFRCPPGGGTLFFVHLRTTSETKEHVA